MRAIILAAGRGSRLNGNAGNLPKCLLNVGGMTILERQIRSLESIGVDHFRIVIGYQAETVISASKMLLGSKVDFVLNSHYGVTNTAVSLALALHDSCEPFYYLNGDVVTGVETYHRLADAPARSAMAVDYKKCRFEEVKVLVAGERIVHIGKHLPPDDAHGEFIGIARFDGGLTAELRKAALRMTQHNGKLMAYFEEPLEAILEHCPATAVDVSDVPTIEIDFPEDLKYAREVLSRRLTPVAIGEAA